MGSMMIPMLGNHKNVSQDDSSLVLNLYGEKVNEDEYTCKPTPGTETAALMSGFGVGRGGCSCQGRVFAVCGPIFQEIVNGTPITRGVLASSQNPVPCISNGFQVMVVDDAKGYVFTLSDNSFKISGADFANFEGGNSIAAFCGGRGVVCKLDGFPVPRWQISGLYDFTSWSDIAFNAAQSLTGPITGMVGIADLLYIFSANQFEIWADKDIDITVFGRVYWGENIGLAAKGSLIAFRKQVFWLGRSQEGKGVFFRHSYGSPAFPISDNQIDRQLALIQNQSDAVAVGYESLGHWFYQVSFKSGNLTLAWDLTTNLWAQRAWREAGSGNLNAIPYVALFESAGELYAVQNLSNKIYRQSDTLYENDGQPIVRRRAFTVIPNESSNLSVFVSAELFGETGNTPVGQPEPNVMWQYSPTRGKTWSREMWRPFSGNGTYNQRCQITGLGAAYTMSFSLTVVANQYISWRNLEVVTA